MKPNLADQLKDLKLDFSSYARLPIREDVLIFENGDTKTVLKQWEKLNYLRKHLQTIDRYIQNNKSEILNDWLKANNTNLSQHVLDKIGSHNNATGGISAYFYNLQNFYDQEEQVYDGMEAGYKMPVDLVKPVLDMRLSRKEKRENRRSVRKIKVKDMKADGKGYLTVVVEEPMKMAAADGAGQPKADTAAVENVLKSAKSNMAIWIGGGLIAITVIAIYANSKSE